MDPLLWPLELRDLFIDSTAMNRLHIEETVFKDVRHYAPRITEALDQIVWPRVAASF